MIILDDYFNDLTKNINFLNKFLYLEITPKLQMKIRHFEIRLSLGLTDRLLFSIDILSTPHAVKDNRSSVIGFVTT